MLTVSQARTNAAKIKKDLLIISLCHLMMQLISKRGFVSALLLSVGCLSIRQHNQGLFWNFYQHLDYAHLIQR